MKVEGVVREFWERRLLGGIQWKEESGYIIASKVSRKRLVEALSEGML